MANYSGQGSGVSKMGDKTGRTILVTGGAGFIGSHFVKLILKKYPDYRIVNYDKLTYAGNPDNLQEVENDSRYSFIEGDIGDLNKVTAALEGVDWVVNFAAETHVDRSILASNEFVDTNVLGTHVLVKAAMTRGIERFLHISTDEVYGSIEEGTFIEESILTPTSPYSASKAAGDLIALSYKHTYGFPVMVTRSSNNFGPNQFPEKVIPLFVTNLLQGKKVPLYGDGLNIRDWIFVEDNCEALDFVLHRGAEGEIYNVGGGEELNNKELSSLILKAFNLDESWIQPVDDRPGHDRRYSISSDKTRRLGWEPRHNFAQALALTIDWYRQNQWWWEKLKKPELPWAEVKA